MNNPTLLWCLAITLLAFAATVITLIIKSGATGRSNTETVLLTFTGSTIISALLGGSLLSALVAIGT